MFASKQLGVGMMLKRFIFGCLVIPATCCVANAQMVDPADPQTVVAALQKLGYRAELSKDPSGDPRIDSAIEGSNFRISFYGCSGNIDCKTLQFASAFDTDPLGWEIVNRWNRTKLVGKVYLDDENDPFIEHVIDAAGGLPEETFEFALERWGSAIAGFKREIGF